MAYNQEKLQAFQEAIREETDQKIAALEEEMRAYEKTELEQAQKVEQQRLEQNKKQQAHEIEAKYMRQITRTRLTRRRSLIAARNRMVDDVFLQAAKKLAEFAASKEYPSYLQKRVTNALDEFPCETAVLTVPKNQLKTAKQFAAALPAITEVREDPNNQLGGFCLLNEEAGILLDETFPSLLEEQRRPFLASCGLKVTF